MLDPFGDQHLALALWMAIAGQRVEQVGDLIADLLESLPAGASAGAIAAVRKRVAVLTNRFPLYSWKFARAAV